MKNGGDPFTPIHIEAAGAAEPHRPCPRKETQNGRPPSGPGRWPTASRRSSRVVSRRGLRDPRLGFVTITDVRVTGDLQHASIFYTVYGTEEERNDSAAALKAATGMLRSEVGRNITARLTPSLEFILDAIPPENAEHIESLLREARERDAEIASAAASAEYAGDADPYVKPREFDDDDQVVAYAEVDGEASDLSDDAELGGAR